MGRAAPSIHALLRPLVCCPQGEFVETTLSDCGIWWQRHVATSGKPAFGRGDYFNADASSDGNKSIGLRLGEAVREYVRTGVNCTEI